MARTIAKVGKLMGIVYQGEGERKGEKLLSASIRKECPLGSCTSLLASIEEKKIMNHIRETAGFFISSLHDRDHTYLFPFRARTYTAFHGQLRVSAVISSSEKP